MGKRILAAVCSGIIMSSMFCADFAEAGLLFHAAKRSAAQSIFKGGFRKSLMKRQARFGPGVYLSKGKSTALSERPGAQSILSFKKSKGFDRRVLDTRSLSPSQLKSKFHINDMRGSVKNGVIGPKLGNKIGSFAANSNKIVAFKSARDAKGANYLIPKKMYSAKSNLISPYKVSDVTP
jgi:hypothetical protein